MTADRLETRNVLIVSPVNFVTAFLDHPFLQGPLETGKITKDGSVETKSGVYNAQSTKGEAPKEGTRVIVYRI